MRTWVLTSPSQFRPGPPPAFDGPRYKAALDEVREVARTRTPEQVRIAWFWNDGRGGGAASYWNEEMARLLAARHVSEREAVHALTVLNFTLADARMACWDAKLAYWLIRPSQADTTITRPVYLPNFPAYPSGHACISGAAAAVIGDFFPNERARVTALAEEAAMSRLYAGVHYRFDNDEGLKLGRAVARFVLDHDRRDELLASVP
jgi:hypothetical protein